MKVLYILAAMMLIGILLLVICSMKVLTDLNATPTNRFARRSQRYHQTSKPAIQPKTQIYVIGTYLGLTFFVVGAAGSILALFQSMRRF